jgi:peptidoglycan hydrolase-like protein with peptidoglycan-binding domain
MRCVVAMIPVTPGFKYPFTKGLSRGMQGPDIIALQHVLMLEGCFPGWQSFTGYYGNITFNGVVALQQKYASEILTPVGLTHGTGNVGPRTLNWLITHYS